MTDAVAVFPPGFRVTDSVGNPVSGAKIKFHEVGPGAVKSVYADADLTVDLGSTVYTNSEGYPVTAYGGATTCLIYVGPDPYYIEITDADDVAIYDAKDHVKGAVDTSTFLTSSSTSTLSMPVVAYTSDHTLDTTHRGKVINGNPAGGDFTLTLDAATTLGNGWNVEIRNGATSGAVKVSAAQSIAHAFGSTTAFILRPGEGVAVRCNGSTFVINGYVPPLIPATTGVIAITGRITAAPASPVAGSRYIVSSAYSPYAVGDIIEANGQGGFIKITPATDCGWQAYVQNENANYQFRDSAWVELTAAALSGQAKAWINFNGTGTPAARVSKNIASITDNGVGDWTLNFTTAFATADYVPVFGCEYQISASRGGNFLHVKYDGTNGTAPTTSALRILGAYGASDASPGAASDLTNAYVAVFGDQ
jgi:hypothetical protein